jgi:hypothetical protein
MRCNELRSGSCVGVLVVVVVGGGGVTNSYFEV